MRICLLIIATNKYTQFLPKLLASINKNFLQNCSDLTINIFTDKINEVFDIVREAENPYTKHKIRQIDHRPFPYSTYWRYHFFKKYQTELHDDFDYYFYIDADTEIVQRIYADDILGERVGVQHCGFVNKRGSYETRKESASYVGPDEGDRYYGGGFWGFSYYEFWEFIEKAVSMVEHDEIRKIIPVWHDESVLNRYFIDNPPTKVLSPSFHWPEKNKRIWDMWPEKYICKILLLNKDHKKLRA